MTSSAYNRRLDSKAFLKTLTHRPGVYRMLGADGEVLYVGKARDLKNRVSSYFRASGQAHKTRAMLTHVQAIEVTVTNTEGEALLLENNLIKSLRPRYNVLLRDDKSYPYIYLSTQQDFPRLGFHRGARHSEGRYFGPYPSAGAVRETLGLLQKVFRVRQCEDGFYRNRSRPCLQYQIKRCTAPCVGLVEQAAYLEDVGHAVMFLEGRSEQVIDELVQRMEAASTRLDYERAAVYRDQIASLRKIQERQYVSGADGNIDIIASVASNGSSCVQVFMIRGGRNLGNKAFFPKHTPDVDAAEVLSAFIPQYYLGKPVPPEILVNTAPEDSDLVAAVLSDQVGHRVGISCRVRGERARWVEMAVTNARHSLAQLLSSKASIQQRLEILQETLQLESIPQRLECFDISHTGGEATVASCVVFDANGPRKSDYRRFNIEGITPGDDFAALHQALMRRYRRIKEGEGNMPDVLFIDGGRGQLSQAADVLEELQIGGVVMIGVAKGVDRKPGQETLFLSGQARPIILPADSPALHLIQQIRDEAHRFAITGHRQRRAKARRGSVLEEISGLGPKRRQQLLRQFGGLQGVSRAGVEDLARVRGISRQLARRIYDSFHHEET